MKKYLKYFIVIIYVVCLASFFVPTVNICGAEFSPFDIIRVCMGMGEDSYSLATQLMNAIVYNFQPFHWIMLLMIIMLVIEIVATLVMKPDKVYAWCIGFGIINGVYTVASQFVMWMKMEEIASALSAVGINLTSDIDVTPLFTWSFIHMVSCVIAVCGVVLVKKSSNGRKKEERPKSIPQYNNKMEQEKAVERPFGGAIRGEIGVYQGRVYPLTDKMEVFFYMEEGKVKVSPYEEQIAFAGIYYISEYGEYCVEPFEKGRVYLESGQPLGMCRKYYLPRGMKIYVNDRSNTFVLA